MAQHSVILMPGAGRTVPVGASTVRLLSVGADTGDLSSVEEIGVPAGFGGPPPHVHHRTHHSWYVLEGELRLTVEDRTHRLGPGGFVHIPTGTPHTFGNDTDRHGRMVQFTTPGGFDRYVEELAAAFPAGTEIDRDTIVAIMARHDTYPA